MKIAVASGKGGTGKTTISLALAEAAGPGTRLLDCDVEEPNCHLFVSAKPVRKPVTVLKPEADEKLCTGCRKCVELCRFNAIAVLGRKILLFPDLCHGCGGCVRVCPAGALKERPYKIGEAGTCEAGNFSLTDGCLSIGQTMSPPLIRAVKKETGEGNGTVILDCPPGTSCSMVTAVREADFVLLVTEPTPFGLHDLTLAVETLRELKLPFGVIINRSDSGDDRVRSYCRAEGIPVLLEIPNRREIAEAYSRGETLLRAVPEWKEKFERMLKKVARRVGGEGKS